MKQLAKVLFVGALPWAMAMAFTSQGTSWPGYSPHLGQGSPLIRDMLQHRAQSAASKLLSAYEAPALATSPPETRFPSEDSDDLALGRYALRVDDEEHVVPRRSVIPAGRGHDRQARR